MNNGSLILAGVVCFAGAQTHAADKVDFHKQIQPIFAKSCVECHGPEKQKGKLRLDLKAEAFKSDEVIVAGKASDSELYKRIILPADHDDIMPAKGDPLTKEQTDLVRLWIDQGAEWPEQAQRLAAVVAKAPEASAGNDKVNFLTDVHPIFKNVCLDCHGPEKQKGDLRLDSKESVFASDHVVVAGKPLESELFIRITLPPDHDDIMPGKGDPLTKQQTDLIKRWIEQGAEWPEGLIAQAEQPEKKEAPAADTAPAATAAPGVVDFTAQIAPLLQSRCLECHGPDKEKGDLRLDQKAIALKTEEPVIVPGDPSASEVFRRISLPAGHDDIMPPKGEPLTKDEIALIQSWISNGAQWPDDFAIKAPVDPTKKVIKPQIQSSEAELKAITDLQAQGIDVRPIAMNVNWHETNLRLQAPDKANEALKTLKNVVTLIDLNLAETNIKDEDLAHLSGLTNLVTLHLEKTAITDEGLKHLKNLQDLTYLNLYGTKVSDEGLKQLSGLQNLKNLYVWQTEVTDAGVEQIKAALPGVQITRGWDLTAKVEEKEEEKKEEKKEEE